MTPWTFITNHAAVLSYLARHPAITALEVAIAVGITERSVRKIIADLEAGGYISKQRQGRHNIYCVNTHLRLRHAAHRNVNVGELLKALGMKLDGRKQRLRARTKPAPPA